MIRPTPRDVLFAMDEMKPGVASVVLSRNRKADAASARRVAMSVATAFGWTATEIAKIFKRDHSTVLSARARYRRIQAEKRDRAEMEAALFRALAASSVAFAQRRAR